MDEFMQKLNKLLQEFDIEDCDFRTKECGNCKLRKVMIEIDCCGDYREYDICDLLELIKDGLE